MQDHKTMEEYCLDVARRGAAVAGRLAVLSGDMKNQWLVQSAAALRTCGSDPAGQSARYPGSAGIRTD